VAFGVDIGVVVHLVEHPLVDNHVVEVHSRGGKRDAFVDVTSRVSSVQSVCETYGRREFHKFYRLHVPRRAAGTPTSARNMFYRYGKSATML
jgi:hypothetical protein